MFTRTMLTSMNITVEPVKDWSETLGMENRVILRVCLISTDSVNGRIGRLENYV